MAERLRWARERAGLSQGQVSAYCETSQGYISDLEAGKRLPSGWELLRKLAEQYEVSAGWIIGTERNPLPSSAPPAPYLGLEMWDVQRVLSPERVEQLVRIGREMVGAQRDARRESDRRLLALMLAVIDHIADDEEKATLAEARHIAATGDMPGAVALIEGFFIRRESERVEQATEKAAY